MSVTPELVYHYQNHSDSDVCVIMPVRNGRHFLAESIGSAAAQQNVTLSIAVIDDGSTDGSGIAAAQLLAQHKSAFAEATLLRHAVSRGPAMARNEGMRRMSAAAALMLDADNIIYPHCARRCLDALDNSGAAFVYPILRGFGMSGCLVSHYPFDHAALATGNYIDNLSLIRRAVWEEVGGFPDFTDGLEDYAFWLTLVERGFVGAQVPEILGAYRMHYTSRTQQVLTRIGDINACIEAEFPWVTLP